jgi:RNA polymerase-binding transcription factor DksA
VTQKKTGADKTAASGSRPKAKVVPAATAAAILGQPVAPPDKKKSAAQQASERAHIRPEWQKYYDRLVELRERLLRQMNGLAKESAAEMEGYSLHMADSGTDNFDRDFALSLLSADQDAIYEIDEAIKRIQKGTYGICELTHKPIPKARLDAIPWTRFTVEAQAQLEREGAIRQRRLGNLGVVDVVAPPEVDEELEEEEKPVKEKE